MPRVMLWGPALWARTGYGKLQTQIGARLAIAGHEVTQFAFAGLFWGIVEYPVWSCPCGSIIPGKVEAPAACTNCRQQNWTRRIIKIYPNGADDYGQTWLPRWHHFLQPDIIIFTYDSWVLSGSMQGSRLPVYYQSPVDTEPLPPETKKSLEGQRVIAISRFAERVYAQSGIKATYIPHGVDPLTYHPGDRQEARKRLRLPEEAFLLVCCATNKGPRKNLGNLLRAFRLFLDRVPEAWEDAFLYFHTSVYRSKDNPTGYNLPEIWHGLGISARIKYPHSVYYEAFGFTEAEMADVYRAADYSVLTSLGEGFGIPLIESLACGTPLIYANHSAISEVVGPGGLSVEVAERMPYELSSSFQWVPSTEQTAERIAQAYLDWKEGGKTQSRLGKAGLRHILRNYAWDAVMSSWLKLVEGQPLPPEATELKAWAPSRDGEVDIVIPTWQGVALKLLPKCVDALYANTKVPFHLILVDDQSTDGTKDYVEGLWKERGNVTYVRPQRKCKGGAQILNIGLRYCRNGQLVSMNNDIYVKEGWLERALRIMDSDPKVGIVGLKFLYPDGTIQHAGGTFLRGTIPTHFGLGESGDHHSETRDALWVSGPCVLVRRECLGKGWDEEFDSFGGHEDVDLCLRARQEGWRVIYCGEAEVVHDEGATVTTLPNFWEQHSRARQIFNEKWLGSRFMRLDSLKESEVT